MPKQNENTVQNPVLQKADLSKEEILYLTSINIFYESFKKGEITEKEMIKIEEKIAKKSGINPLSVYRINDLITPPTRATIVSGEKEVISNEINKVRKITKTD